MARLAFLGLGVMGYPMAGHLATRGSHELAVYNRTPARARAWAGQFGGRVADTPASAAQGADIVFCCVGDDPDLRQVATGAHGAFESMGRDSVFVDHTTTSAKVARELAAEAKRRGFEFLDAPVSGGQAGAQSGTLTVMVGGEDAAYEQAKPLIAHFARAVTRMGPSGSGQLTKMVNQICIAGMLEGLSEGISFGLKMGLDVAQVLEVIGQGAAQSWQMDNRGKAMIEDKFDFGFAVDWMRKDLRICLEEGEAHGAPLPVTRLVDAYYAEIQDMGGGRWDTSSLIRRLRRH